MLSPGLDLSTSPALSTASVAADPLAGTPATLPAMATMTPMGSIPVPNVAGMLESGFKIFGALGVLSFLKQLAEGRNRA